VAEFWHPTGAGHLGDPARARAAGRPRVRVDRGGLHRGAPFLFGALSLIGTAVWVITMSLIGYGVGSAWQSIAHEIAVAGYGAAAVVVLAVAAFIISRLREVRLERQRAGR